MEESIVFHGINFRSESHLLWFEMSMLVLAAVALFMILIVVFQNKALIQTTISAMTGLIYFHGSTVLMAIIATRLGTVNGKVYSVDCIWFNALMAVIYLSTYGLIKFFMKGV